MLNQIDLSRTDLNLLVLFETVMREQHVGRAASALNLSPSAVSHGLGRLRRLMNDPLFLRTPRGVVPTDRAKELAPRIADILGSVRQVMAAAEPFDPATSTRRFRIAMPDMMLAVFAPQLIERVAREAPEVKLALVHTLASYRNADEPEGWTHVLDRLDSGDLDLAMVPYLSPSDIPARFHAVSTGFDYLLVLSRPGHPFARDPSIDSYCAARHIITSVVGDLSSGVDATLAAHGRSRTVVGSVPNTMLAMFVAASTDVLTSAPMSATRAQAARFGLVATPFPFEAGGAALTVIVTEAAHADAGVAWLRSLFMDLVEASFS